MIVDLCNSPVAIFSEGSRACNPLVGGSVYTPKSASEVESQLGSPLRNDAAVCDRVLERCGLTGIDKGELVARGCLVDGKETALGGDDERFRGQLVAGLADEDGVVGIQQLLVHDIAVWRSVGKVGRQLKRGNVTIGGGLTSEDGGGRDLGSNSGEEECGSSDELLHFCVIGD